MTETLHPSRQQHLDRLLQYQPELGNPEIAKLVGGGVSGSIVRLRRQELGIPANPTNGEKNGSDN